MKIKTNIKLNLSPIERKNLRKNKVKISEITNFAIEELEELLKTSTDRAKEVYALADFQRIPSIGINFAEDLVFLGFYAIAELKGKDGARLRDQYEKKKGYKIDSCVEDQFRLAVYFSDTEDYAKNWWDFTSERKKYREKYGYPDDRPTKNWTEVINRR